MKFRAGYVSNSSTSSFIVYGCLLSREVEEKVSDYSNDLVTYDFNKDKFICGVSLKVNKYLDETREYDIAKIDFNTHKKHVLGILKGLGIEGDFLEFYLYTGIYSC